MPTYDYKCEACGHRFDQFQSITAAPLKRCPTCGKNKLHRLIGTGAGVIFKGSGFYTTDYRSEGYKEKAKAESGTSESKDAAKSAHSKGASNSDAAPAARTESKPAAETESKPSKKT